MKHFGLPNDHRLYIGPSGKGKNVSVLRDLIDHAIGRRAVVYFDPRGDNTPPIVAALWRRWPRVIVDDLTRTDVVIPIRAIRCSFRTGSV